MLFFPSLTPTTIVLVILSFPIQPSIFLYQAFFFFSYRLPTLFILLKRKLCARTHKHAVAFDLISCRRLWSGGGRGGFVLFHAIGHRWKKEDDKVNGKISTMLVYSSHHLESRVHLFFFELFFWILFVLLWPKKLIWKVINQNVHLICSMRLLLAIDEAHSGSVIKIVIIVSHSDWNTFLNRANRLSWLNHLLCF